MHALDRPVHKSASTRERSTSIKACVEILRGAELEELDDADEDVGLLVAWGSASIVRMVECSVA